MSFVEFRFLWFFLVVFIVYWTMRSNAARKVWLLLCSYGFYAAWNWKFTFLVLGSTTVDYIVGQMLGRSESPAWRRFWIATSVCVNLGVLAFFKYFNFFVSSASGFLAWLGLPASVNTLNIILPVGISFYTFHSMSYTIDVYRGKQRVDWCAVLRHPDLLRFFRLHRHGHRCCPATWVPITEQLPVSLLCPERL